MLCKINQSGLDILDNKILVSQIRHSIKHNQTSTDSECSGTTGLHRAQRAHVTPLFISLHWLPVTAHIEFKTLMLAYRTTTGSAPSYFHSLLRIYIPSRSLRSASEQRRVVPSQRLKIPLQNILVHCSQAGGTIFPPYLECWIPDNFQAQLKTHIFCDATWLHPKLKEQK